MMSGSAEEPFEKLLIFLLTDELKCDTIGVQIEESVR